MTTTQGVLWRDANYEPIQGDGLVVSKTLSINGNNATSANPIFTLSGAVEVRGLYGVVTTTLSSNITAAFWRLNDQTAQASISLATGTTLSAATAGSAIARRSLVSVALTLINAAAGAVSDPVAATAPSYLMPFGIAQKTGGVLTQIEFVYTTTNAPATGEIKFYARYIPLSEDGQLIAA